MADVQETIDELTAHIDEVAGDAKEFSQGESAEIYEELSSHCSTWAQQIRSEMED
jgi:hypothetical protein